MRSQIGESLQLPLSKHVTDVALAVKPGSHVTEATAPYVVNEKM